MSWTWVWATIVINGLRATKHTYKRQHTYTQTMCQSTFVRERDRQHGPCHITRIDIVTHQNYGKTTS